MHCTGSQRSELARRKLHYLRQHDRRINLPLYGLLNYDIPELACNRTHISVMSSFLNMHRNIQLLFLNGFNYKLYSSVRNKIMARTVQDNFQTLVLPQTLRSSVFIFL